MINDILVVLNVTWGKPAIRLVQMHKPDILVMESPGGWLKTIEADSVLEGTGEYRFFSGSVFVSFVNHKVERDWYRAFDFPVNYYPREVRYTIDDPDWWDLSPAERMHHARGMIRNKTYVEKRELLHRLCMPKEAVMLLKEEEKGVSAYSKTRKKKKSGAGAGKEVFI